MAEFTNITLRKLYVYIRQSGGQITVALNIRKMRHLHQNFKNGQGDINLKSAISTEKHI